MPLSACRTIRARRSSGSPPVSAAADIRVAVLINGRQVVNDVASPGGDWTRNVELPDLGEEASLNIEIDSDADVARGNAQALGVRLRLLSLER